MTEATDSPLESRITSLEVVVTHLQHDLAQMNEVLLEQQAGLRLLKAIVDQWDGRLQQVLNRVEQRSLEDDRPPHY